MTRATILIAILFFLCFSGTAWSQTPKEGEVVVHTTTGLRFVGTLISEDGEKISLQTRSGAVEIPRSLVKRIDRPNEDRRPASERIAAQEVPAGQEVEFLLKADEAYKAGDFQTVVAISKGLQPRIAALNPSQREANFKLAAGAYFELKDWRATAVSLRFAARALESDIDRQRLDAIAEAIEAANMPDVGGQTVENIEQLKAAAMKWKAEQCLKQACDYMINQKELHRQEALEKALDVARQTLGRAEAFVPGFSIERWNDVLKASAGYMLAAVERAIPRLEEDRNELVRTYMGAVASVRHAATRNELVISYLSRRSAASGTLSNLEWMEKNSETKELYEKDKATALGKQVEDFRFYHSDPINARVKIKGLEIKPMSIGG